MYAHGCTLTAAVAVVAVSHCRTPQVHTDLIDPSTGRPMWRETALLNAVSSATTTL
jgi:hypothetical protein